MKVKVYIAHHSITKARALAEQLIAEGLPRENIVSEWVFSDPAEFGSPKTDKRRAKIASDCINDVARTDVLILVGEKGHKGSGGKQIELGYAMGRDKHVIVYGHHENTLHHHYSIGVAATFEQLVLLLRASFGRWIKC